MGKRYYGTDLDARAARNRDKPAARPAAPLPPVPPASRIWIQCFLLIVLVAVILTVFVGYSAWQHKDAMNDLTKIINDAKAKDDPVQVVTAIDQYMKDHPSSPIEAYSNEKLAEARRAQDDADFRKSDPEKDGRRVDPDIVRLECERYQSMHPDGAHKDEAQARLDTIETLRDEFAWQVTQDAMEEAGDNRDTRIAHLQNYRDDYPKGRHADEAKSIIERKNENDEAQALKDYQRRIAAKVNEGNPVEAFVLLDKARDEIKAAARLARLDETENGIRDRLEKDDWETSNQEIPSDAAARRTMRASCRLYLLCYPASPRVTAIKQKLRAIADTQRDADWKEFTDSISELSTESAEAVAAIETYVTRSGDYSRRAAAKTAELRVRFITRMLTVALKDYRRLTVKGRGTFLAKINSLDKDQVTVTPADNAAFRASVAEIERDEEPPLLDLLRKLREMVRSGDGARPIDLESIGSELRAVHADRDAEKFRAPFRELSAVLEKIDVEKPLIRDFLDREKNPIDIGRGVMTPSEILSFYADYSRDQMGDGQSMLAHFPKTHEFTPQFSQQSITIHLVWSIDPPNLTSRLRSAKNEPFQGEVVLIYPTHVRRDESVAMPPPLPQQVDAKLAEMNNGLTTRVTLEFIAKRRLVMDMGLHLSRRDARLRVDSIPSGSPADLKGLEVGDAIIRVGNKRISEEAAQDDVMKLIKRSDTADLTLLRSQRRFRIKLGRASYYEDQYEARSTQKLVPDNGIKGTDHTKPWSPVDPPGVGFSS